MMMNHQRLTYAAAALAAMAAVCLTGTSSSGMGTNHHLHFFMHVRQAAPSATAVVIVNGTGAPVMPDIKFGDTGTYVTTSLPEERRPAVLVSMNIVLNGSTVAVMGHNEITLPVRELAVVGGTGSFRMATGYVLWKTSSWHGKIAVLELDLYLRTT
nr:unnamed protein product [Digitaria exilis]